MVNKIETKHKRRNKAKGEVTKYEVSVNVRREV